MNSYDAIVGANNDAHVVEIDKIIEITSKFYDKYMVASGVVSVENNKQEKLAIVTVTSEEDKLIEYCQTICRILNQREVAYRVAGEIKSITE